MTYMLKIRITAKCAQRPPGGGVINEGDTFALQLLSGPDHPFQLPKYTTLLHKKSYIVRVLYKHVLPFGH